MRFQRLVQIQAAKALDIKAGEPHGAYEYHAERIFAVLELFVQPALFHFGAVRANVQPPVVEGLPLVLLLTDDNRHFGFFHPCQLALHFLRFLLGNRAQARI